MNTQSGTTVKPVSILFERRSEVSVSNERLQYDPRVDMNIVDTSEGPVVAVDSGILLSTNSKTLAAPRDDDPDPGRRTLL